MAQYNQKRNDSEWLQLIQTCRSSGYSDKVWCELNGIPLSSFYNRVSRLRKKACEIPDRIQSTVQPVQQVVPIEIIQDDPASVCSKQIQTTNTIPGIPAITLTFGSYRMEIHNHAEKDIITNTVLALQKLC